MICLSVNADLTWMLFVNDREVTTTLCSVLHPFPHMLTSETFSRLLAKLDSLHICVGQPDPNFIHMVTAKKGKIVSNEGRTVCILDNTDPQTVRTADCEILSASVKCSACTKYRATLRAMYHRWSKKQQQDMQDSSTFTNDCYLNTPQKQKQNGETQEKGSCC